MGGRTAGVDWQRCASLRAQVPKTDGQAPVLKCPFKIMPTSWPSLPMLNEPLLKELFKPIQIWPVFQADAPANLAMQGQWLRPRAARSLQLMLSSNLSSHFTGSDFWAVFVHWQLCWISVCIHEQPPLYQHMLGTDFSGQLRGSKCSEHYPYNSNKGSVQSVAHVIHAMPGKWLRPPPQAFPSSL